MANPGKKILDGLHKQLGHVINGSPQGVYLYLDDHHTVFNKHFAKMLGYSSPAAVSKLGATGFLETLVKPASQKTIATAYWNAVEKNIASSFSATLKKKSGAGLKVKGIIVPISYQNEMFALHFIWK